MQKTGIRTGFPFSIVSCRKKQKMIEYTQSFATKAQEGNGLDSH